MSDSYIFKRDDSVSISKGIAIMMMVLAHAQFSQYGDHFFTLFHMPLFFYFSGYCFKEKYLDNAKEFVFKRIKGIYIPYVKWALLFLAFHNLFYYLNLYNSYYGYHGNVSYKYDLSDFLEHAIRIITSLSSHEQLLGGYWFLHTMFFASFIFYATLKYFKKPISGGGILLILCVLTLVVRVKIPYFSIGAREILAAFFMIIGYCYRKSNYMFENSIFIIPVAVFLLILGTFLWPCGMLSLTWQKVVPYSLSACAGTLMVFSISKIIMKIKFLRGFFIYVGEHTLLILTWHMLSFKVVSLLIIWYYNLSITHLAEFPVMAEFASIGWWLLYFIVGVCLPLLVILIKDRLNLRFSW